MYLPVKKDLEAILKLNDTEVDQAARESGLRLPPEMMLQLALEGTLRTWNLLNSKVQKNFGIVALNSPFDLFAKTTNKKTGRTSFYGNEEEIRQFCQQAESMINSCSPLMVVLCTEVRNDQCAENLYSAGERFFERFQQRAQYMRMTRVPLIGFFDLSNIVNGLTWSDLAKRVGRKAQPAPRQRRRPVPQM